MTKASPTRNITSINNFVPAMGLPGIILSWLGLLAPLAAAYLQPTGPTIATAVAGAGSSVWGRSHADLTMAALKLLVADGRENAEAALSAPADIAAIMDGAGARPAARSPARRNAARLPTRSPSLANHRPQSQP